MSITITPTQLLPLQVRVQKQLDLKTLFSATDSGGTIDHYKVTLGAGFGGSIRDVTTNTTYHAGDTFTALSTDSFTYTASSSVGSESFTVQASDDGVGATYSDAVTVLENVVADTAPTVMAVPNDPTTITVNKTFGAAQLFQATDVNFDPIASYTITTPAAGSGTFSLINGATTLDQGLVTGALAASTTYSISGADLANLTFKTGNAPGTTTFKVAASDGLATGTTLPITLTVNNHTLPTVTTSAPAAPILIGGGFTPASSLIAASDLDGSTITGYTIQVTGANNGFFTLNHNSAVALDANNQFFVTAAQFATLEYRSNLTTAGTDSFNVTAIATPDPSTPANVVFSPVTPLSVKVVATAPPVVTQSAGASSVAPGSTIAASSLFTAVDPKGDPVKGYSIIPTSAGQFTLNAVALTANDPNFVSATDFPNLRYVASAVPGNQTFQVAASDGISLGNFATITVGVVTPSTPTITIPSSVPNLEPNNPALASTLFNGSETGGTIQGFSIIVPSSVGHLTLDGTTLATDQPVFVTSSDFANLKFVATAAPGSASIQAAAYDGTSFSAYKTVPMNLVGPTVAQVGSLTNKLETNGIYSASTLFSLKSVSGGAAITGLSIQTPPASQGTFFNGSTQLASNQPVFINAADLANLTLHVGNSAGALTFQVSAFDGISFGRPAQFALTSVVNSEPTVAAARANEQVMVGQSVLASSLFTATDINSDAIAAYEITPGAAPGGGVFSGSGLSFTPGVATTVSAAAFATLTYTAGGPSPTITLAGNVQQPGAFPGTAAIPGSYTFVTNDGASYTATLQLDFTGADATSADLEIATLTPVGSAPAVTAVLPLTLGTIAFDGSNAATSFTPTAAAVSVSATGKLLLGTGSLKFTGLTDTAAATDATGSVQSFQTGQDSFTVKARDANAANFASSTATTIKVFAAANRSPGTVGLPQTLPLVTGTQLAGASLFAASDPEGDAIQSYSIVPPAASVGTFSGFTSQDPVSGLIYVKAADLANLRFTPASAGRSSFQVSAFDGNSWSAATTVALNITAPQPATITLTPPAVLRPNASIAASTLFSATDPRGATVQGYSITTPAGNNGYFTLNGVKLASDAQNYISAAQLSSLAFVAGPQGGPATFTVAVFNGTLWSNLSSETVNIANYKAPVVTAASGTLSVVAGGSTSVASLINTVTTDPTTSVQQYVLSASAGSFKLGSQTVDATKPFTVSAANLASLQYVAGSTTGKVTLNVAANDGTSTGASTPLALTVTENKGPVISLLPQPQLLPGQPVPVTQLFSATDNTGSAITSYIVQINSGDGTFQLNGAALPTTGPQTVSAADLAKLSFVPGNNVTSFTVSAVDAIAKGQPTTLVLSATQSKDSIMVATNPLPSVAHNTTIPVKQLLTGIAAAGKTLQGFNLSTDVGQFLLNNVALTSAQASLVSAADFANLVFAAPATAGTVHITSAAYDGTTFGPALTLALSIT